MKSVFIGSVGGSSVTFLNELISAKFPVNMVFSLDESYSETVSGYFPIHNIAEKHGLKFTKFRKICDPENIAIIKEIEPDYIFVIGLSQLVSKELIDCAKIGVVGFHPTPLPKFRGRAAIVWQILLGIRDTKCSLFFIDEGMDSGDILGQESYTISDSDYVSDVSEKLNVALKSLTCKVLRQILDGTICPVKQNEEEATYLMVRKPEDGLINWSKSADDVFRLVRATSHPYPGAFCMYDGNHRIIIWRAEVCPNNKYIGIPGQICEIKDNSFDVLCGEGILHVTDWENIDNVKICVGHKMN